MRVAKLSNVSLNHTSQFASTTSIHLPSHFNGNIMQYLHVPLKQSETTIATLTYISYI